jgi:membrane protease YdiL (CAAX protease family)
MKKMNFLERALVGKNEWWKYLVVFLVGYIGAQIIGGILFPVVIIIKVLTDGGDISQISANLNNLSALDISNNLEMLINMFPFVVWLLLSVVMVKMLHNRTFSETVNGLKKIRWSRIVTGIAVWGIISLVFMTISFLIDRENYVLQFDAAKFIPLLIIALIFIPLQTTTEEFIFRGYFTQGIGSKTRNRWLALIIPAVLFGLLHIFNPEVKMFGFWLMMPQYILFGLFFGLTSILDDGIEIAMGMHFVNNFLTLLVVTQPSSALQTDAIFKINNYNPTFWDILAFILIAAIAIFIFYKKYKWDFSIMNKKVALEP